ncbi:MAG TPA: hypothetical protein VIT23_13815 [Terrimicrobiaceae bacterium]
MPKITIQNKTKKTNSALPNGVKLLITVGTAEPVKLDIDKSQTFNVARNQVIRIQPENKIMQGANYTALDGNDKTLSIVPSDDLNVFGVKIA